MNEILCKTCQNAMRIVINHNSEKPEIRLRCLVFPDILAGLTTGNFECKSQPFNIMHTTEYPRVVECNQCRTKKKLSK